MTEQKEKENNEHKNSSSIYCLGLLMISLIGLNEHLSCRLSKIEKMVQPQEQKQQIIGNETPDKFYEINGQKAYLAVDGKSIEQYFEGER